jgi:hypothetical protein
MVLRETPSSRTLVWLKTTVEIVWVRDWRPYRESNPVEVLRIASLKRPEYRVNKGYKRNFTFLDKSCYNEAMRILLVRNCQENKF